LGLIPLPKEKSKTKASRCPPEAATPHLKLIFVNLKKRRGRKGKEDGRKKKLASSY